MIGRVREYPSAGEREPDRDRAQSTANRPAQSRVGVVRVQARDRQGQQYRRKNDRQRGHDRAGPAGELPAEQRDEHHVGAGRRLAERVGVGELRAAQPVVGLHHIALQIRQDRTDAAYGHQRQQ